MYEIFQNNFETIIDFFDKYMDKDIVALLIQLSSSSYSTFQFPNTAIRLASSTFQFPYTPLSRLTSHISSLTPPLSQLTSHFSSLTSSLSYLTLFFRPLTHPMVNLITGSAGAIKKQKLFIIAASHFLGKRTLGI